MALKTYKPTTPGQRGLVLIDRSELWKGRPVKSLTEGLTKTGGRNNVGRLAVRGPTGCRYLADERQRNYVPGGKMRGWNLTGDAYAMDEDGYFVYQARTDDMIISGGYNIAGPEVESALLLHPAVAECGVIGKPDPVAGEIVKAFVALKPGFEPDAALHDELMAHARKRLGAVVAPKELEFAPSLPKTRSGKIMRRLLKARELGLPEGDTSTLENA